MELIQARGVFYDKPSFTEHKGIVILVIPDTIFEKYNVYHFVGFAGMVVSPNQYMVMQCLSESEAESFRFDRYGKHKSFPVTLSAESAETPNDLWALRNESPNLINRDRNRITNVYT